MEIAPRYTALADPAVDNFVQEQLDNITAPIVELMGNDLRALVLAGGFGRSEGSVLVGDNGRMHVVNDYDIEVIYRQRFGYLASKLLIHLRYEPPLNRLAERLAEQLEVKQIDLSLRGETSFAMKGPPRLADYDLRYGNKLLYGENNPVDSMPEWKSFEIPALEGTWLLRNRAIGLLLANFYLLEDGTIAGGKTEYFFIEINKALLAMGDTLFILNGAYHHSYDVRAAGIAGIIPDDFGCAAELADLYTMAAEYKLRPRGNMFENRPPRDLWHQVNELYQKLFIYHESRRLNRDFTSIRDYAEMLGERPGMQWSQRARFLFDRLRGATSSEYAYLSHIKADRMRSVAFSFVLLAALRPGGTDNHYLQLASRMAGLQTPQDWTRLTRDFLMLIHPKGELGRALREQGDVRR